MSSPQFIPFEDHLHRAIHPHTILPPSQNLQSLGQHPQLAPPPQIVATEATADGTFRPLNFADFISVLMENRFRGRSEADKSLAYKNLLDIMNVLTKGKSCVIFFLEEFALMIPRLKTNSIATPEVTQRVATPLRGYSELIRGLNTFLPPGYRLEISSDPRQDVITYTTPMGVDVLTQSSDGSIRRLPQNPLPPQPPSVATPSPTPPSNPQSLSVNASNLRQITPQSVAQAQIPLPQQLPAPTQTPNDAAVSILGNTSGRSGQGPSKIPSSDR